MRKSILMISALMMLMACGGKKAQGESVNAGSDSIAERQQYRFECQFIKAENEECQRKDKCEEKREWFKR